MEVEIDNKYTVPQKVDKLPYDILWKIFLYHLDNDSLKNSCLTHSFPQICENEEFWEARLSSQFGIQTPFQGKTYRETWELYTKEIIYIFDFNFVTQILMDEPWGLRHTGQNIIVDDAMINEMFQEFFFNSIKSNVEGVLERYPRLFLRKYSVDLASKKVVLTIIGIHNDHIKSTVGTEIKEAIERVYEERDQDDLDTSIVYLDRLLVTNYITMGIN